MKHDRFHSFSAQFKSKYSGRQEIRTLDTLLKYTHFPGVLHRPLGQPSFGLRRKGKKFLNQLQIFLKECLQNKVSFSDF
jgi:hypothetical protein